MKLFEDMSFNMNKNFHAKISASNYRFWSDCKSSKLLTAQ